MPRANEMYKMCGKTFSLNFDVSALARTHIALEHFNSQGFSLSFAVSTNWFRSVQTRHSDISMEHITVRQIYAQTRNGKNTNIRGILLNVTQYMNVIMCIPCNTFWHWKGVRKKVIRPWCCFWVYFTYYPLCDTLNTRCGQQHTMSSEKGHSTKKAILLVLVFVVRVRPNSQLMSSLWAKYTENHRKLKEKCPKVWNMLTAALVNRYSNKSMRRYGAFKN